MSLRGFLIVIVRLRLQIDWRQKGPSFQFNLFLWIIQLRILNSAKLCHSAIHATCHSANSFLLLPSPVMSSEREFRSGLSQFYRRNVCLRSKRGQAEYDAFILAWPIKKRQKITLDRWGKRPNEFAEWRVARLAEWHNYAEFNIRSWIIQRNKLNWKERPFLAPIL